MFVLIWVVSLLYFRTLQTLVVHTYSCHPQESNVLYSDRQCHEKSTNIKVEMVLRSRALAFLAFRECKLCTGERGNAKKFKR